jgi:predicted nucleic acid-binding protein
LILLDTNVLSEMMKPTPHDSVRRWVDAQDKSLLWMSAISAMELRIGVEILPPGSRRGLLTTSLEIVLTQLFAGRVLPFDLDAAEAAARVSAHRRLRGRNVEWRDTQIGGAALSRQAIVATRNTRDFDDLDLKLVNPWTAPINP